MNLVLHITKFFCFFILTYKNNCLRGAFLVILWLKIVLWYFLSISWNKLCFTTYDIFLYLKGFNVRKQIIRQRLVMGTLIFIVILQEGSNRGMGRPLILHPLQWWGNLFLVNLSYGSLQKPESKETETGSAWRNMKSLPLPAPEGQGSWLTSLWTV